MTNERDRPTRPADLDRDAREALSRLEELDADGLRAVGSYLEELAVWTEATGDGTASASGLANSSVDGPGADLEYPPDVPERAEVTVKEIAGSTYYYYQWREGDRIESKTVER